MQRKTQKIRAGKTQIIRVIKTVAHKVLSPRTNATNSAKRQFQHAREQRQISKIIKQKTNQHESAISWITAKDKRLDSHSVKIKLNASVKSGQCRTL